MSKNQEVTGRRPRAVTAWENRPIIPFRTAFSDEQESLRVDIHYAVEVGIVQEGAMERRYGRWPMVCRPGEVWLHSMWEIHNFRIVEAPCRVVGLCVSPEVLARYPSAGETSIDWLLPFSCAPRDRPRVGDEKSEELLRLASRLEAAILSDAPKRDAWFQVLLIEILLTVQEHWRPPAKRGQFLFGEYERIGPGLELAFGTRQFVSEQTAARACGLSRNAFMVTFQQVTGISFAKFALRHRLKGAAAELLAREASPKEIAARWGFVDLSHFHRRFRQYYGCAPGEYRRRATYQIVP